MFIRKIELNVWVVHPEKADFWQQSKVSEIVFENEEREKLGAFHNNYFSL